jgi:hypothetical protein
MPNGILKYKQDDGSIVELTPVGVDTEARALATTEAARAKAAEQKLENDKADKSAIPDVSALVTKEIYDAGQAAQDAKIAALKAVTPDILPYLFDRISVSSAIYSSVATSYAVAYIDLPWLHSQNHQLTARLSGGLGFYVVNLSDGSVQSVDNGSITVFARCDSSKPYHVNVGFQLSVPIAANTPYLVYSTSAFVVIE